MTLGILTLDKVICALEVLKLLHAFNIVVVVFAELTLELLECLVKNKDVP